MNLRVYVVWVPSLPADREETVAAAVGHMPDERVVHFWDEKALMRVAYQRVMKMKEPAWDVYYLYDGSAEWKTELPPAPLYYMHQLDSLPKERVLDGDKLAGKIEELLTGTKAV